MTKKLESKYDKLCDILGNSTFIYPFSMYYVFSDLLKKYKAIQLVNKELADCFKKAGFLVTLDFDNKTFVVAEV